MIDVAIGIDAIERVLRKAKKHSIGPQKYLDSIGLDGHFYRTSIKT